MKLQTEKALCDAFGNIPRTLRPDDTMADLVGYFVRNPDFSVAIVQGQDGEIIGVVNKTDILKSLFDRVDPDSPLEKFISPDFRAISVKEATLDAVLKQAEDNVGDIVILNEQGGYLTAANCFELIKLAKRDRILHEEAFSALLDSAYEGILAIDKDCIVTVFNLAAGRMLNLEPRKVIGRPIREAVPTSSLPDVLASGKEQTRHRHRQGDKTFLTNRTPIYLNGEIIGAMAQFQDIGGAEDPLFQLADTKEFLELLNLILDNAYVGIIFCDASGIIRFMNRQYEELLGVPRETAYGKHITEYFPDSRLPLVIKNEKPEYGWKYNFRGRTTLIVNRIPVKKGTKLIGAIAQCIFRDISEIKIMASKLDLLETKIRNYKKELSNLLAPQYSFNDIIGTSEAINNTKKIALSFGRTKAQVLISGETGTGKELFAHSIHQASGRSGGPFVSVNCASIPNELFESELFGYAPGAFTGASQKGKAGKVELADGGTLFLDEIGDMPLQAQAKLLRVTEQRRFERVGAVNPEEVDFRLISATNKDLISLIKEGRFREDLYYRISALTLQIPSLRHRLEDIPVLARYFIQQKADSPVDLTVQAIQCLMSHNWPGNIRELKNVIERALVILELEGGSAIHARHLPANVICRDLAISGPEEPLELDLKKIVQGDEEEAIRKALAFCKGNKAQAARLLGISRSVFYCKLKRYNISPGCNR